MLRGGDCESEESESSVGGDESEEASEDEDEAAMARVLGALSAVRPVVETGFENTLLARALLEQLPAGTPHKPNPVAPYSLPHLVSSTLAPIK